MIKLIQGDCLDRLKELETNSIDSIVTDPPYELGFMGKSWDNTGIANNKEMWAECLRVLKPGGHLLAFSGTRTYHRMASAIEDAGFEVRDMIEYCYGSGFPKSLNIWKHLKKNCTCGNMEVYEKRIQLQQTLGEAETEYEMRLMQEGDLPQTVNAEKERGEVLQSGLSEQSTPIKGLQLSDKIRKGQSSLEGRDNVEKNSRELSGNDLCEVSEGISADGEERRIHNATQIGNGSTYGEIIREGGSSASQRPQPEKQQYREPCAFCKQYGTQAIRTLGTGTALKPAHEPICMARKPLAEKTVAENCLKYGTGGINIDESRVGTEVMQKTTSNGEVLSNNRSMTGANYKRIPDGEVVGRFPANLIHDNSEEVRECFPETKSGAIKVGQPSGTNFSISGELNKRPVQPKDIEANSGNASRFFKSIIYQAKASKSERNKGMDELDAKEWKQENSPNPNREDRPFIPVKNNHPTIKPISLMEYLIKMVTPKKGVVLDPFMGSGSTGVACVKNGYSFIGIEKEEEYIKIAKARIYDKE